MKNMKKQISAEIIADSKNEFGDRITTFVLTFPRFILAELNTHRAFSRNSASSRAIPFKKMVKMVDEDPFIPIAWQKDHKGMQGTEYFEPSESQILEYHWLSARNRAVESAKILYGRDQETKLSKQLCNRLLEPFMWHTAIVTSTEFENFFKQRCPEYYADPENKYYRSKKDFVNEFWNPTFDDNAIPESWNKSNPQMFLRINKGQGEIHIMELAEQMWDAINESQPKQLEAGEWHIPFGDNISSDVTKDSSDIKQQANLLGKDLIEYQIKIATARCARISYLNFEGKDDYEADIKLHDRLAKMHHWSPFEHCARAIHQGESRSSRNFKGFIQYRSLVEK